MKSRVAIAPATITVAVTSITSGGSSSPTRTDAASTLTTPRPGTPAASDRRRSPRTPPATGTPITSSADSTPTRFATSRQPSSSSTSDDDRIRLEPRVLRMRASRPPTGRSPAPTTRSRSTSSEWHRGHIGRGGWRNAPHPSQRWTSRRRSRSAVPEELRVGRRRRREPRRQGHDPPASTRPLGSNFRMRNVWRPTDVTGRVGVGGDPRDEASGTEAGLLLGRDRLEHGRRPTRRRRARR